MPRQCEIMIDDAVNALKKYIDYFESGDNFPSPKSEVWDSLSKECGGKWSINCWRTNIMYNRRQLLTKARIKKTGIVCNVDMKKNTEDVSNLNKNFNKQYDECASALLNTSNRDLRTKFEIFNLYLSSENWDKIKPGNKNSYSLRPHVWTNVIALEFWKQFRLPCAYIFKKSCIHRRVKCKFLEIYGECASAKCKNFFYGVLKKEPKENLNNIYLTVKTKNTIFDKHEFMRRPLNGLYREEIGQNCINDGADTTVKKLATELLQQGDIAEPIIPSKGVLRRAKMELENKQIGLESKINETEDLHNLQRSEVRYVGSVQDIGLSPFYVFYGTTEQDTAYKQYCRITDIPKISIDCTGSIVKKILHPNKNKSAHIFLYCIVINFNNTILSAYQMLSEVQDVQMITLWIKRWMQKVKKKPKEVVVDYSKALLCACSLAFNEMSLKLYIQTCFQSIQKNGKVVNYAPTYIRVDVAHMIHLVCRWKCFSDTTHKAVRDFYVRCVSLLIECQNLLEFEEIFRLTSTVASHRYENTVVNDENETIRDARLKLETYISTKNLNDVNFERMDEKAAEIGKSDSVVTDNADFIVKNYITNLIESTEDYLIEGWDLNPFYLPGFVVQLQRISQEFPLWSAVGVPYDAGHATSSSSETYFRDVKHNYD